MNLLFLTYQGDMAGSTNSIYFLTKGLAERGHQVYMGCRKESLLYQMLQDTKVQPLPMTFKGKLDGHNMRQIRDAVQRYDIQLINAQSSLDRYTSIFARWRYKLPVKVVHTRRNFPQSIGGWIQSTFYAKGTDKIVAVSDELKKGLVKMGIPASHLHVIYNGVPKERYQLLDPEKVNSLRKKWNLDPTHKVIGFVGRNKRQDQLIEALQYLDQDITVIFVGITEEYIAEDLKKHAPRQRIICTGKISAEEVIQYYALFDVKVLASYEGFGLVLVEAMGMGVPVVGTNAMGIKNTVEDGVSGLLFEDKNTEDLAKKVRLILEDQDLRQNLIRNGLERAHQQFSVDNTVRNYEEFFGSLINGE